MVARQPLGDLLSIGLVLGERPVDAKSAMRERCRRTEETRMRAALLMVVAMLGLAVNGPAAAQSAPGTAASAQADSPRRPQPRVTVTPRQPSADPYPSPGAAYPGPGYVRDCAAYYVEDPRPSGTVIVPRMRCWWVRS